MKIKVADLEPNPFRKIKEYPIDRDKVEALKTSIKEKTFWDNILVRPHPTKKGKYQLAYGHHRHVCLIELNIKEINVPVRELDDSLMLKIMAEENLAWSTSPAIMTQTILTAKEFLENEILKYKDLGHAGEIASMIFSSNSQYINCKENGVGRDILVKFLGGNWTSHKIRIALSIIHDEGLDQNAVREIPTLEQADHFRVAVKQHETPKPIQKKIVKTIIKDGVGRRDIPALVEKFSPPIPNLKKKRKRKIKAIPNIAEYVFKCENDTDSLNHRIKVLIPEITEIATNGRLLGRLAPGLTRLNKTIIRFSSEYERNRNGKGKEKTKKVAAIQVLD